MWPYLPLINTGSHAVGNRAVVVEIMAVLPDAVKIRCDNNLTFTVTLELKSGGWNQVRLTDLQDTS